MKQNRLYILMAALILMAAGTRILNAEMGLYNFAPVAALGLFSGAVLQDKRMAFLFPLLSMLLADLYFQLFTNTPGFYGVSQLFNYAGLLAVAALGTRMGRIKPLKVAVFAIGGSLLFFLLSNFGVWVEGYYGHTFAGLATTFEMAIPFYKNTLAGDLAGSALLFGGYYLLTQATAARLQKASI